MVVSKIKRALDRTGYDIRAVTISPTMATIPERSVLPRPLGYSINLSLYERGGDNPLSNVAARTDLVWPLHSNCIGK
jgi:hypothetical protein